MICLFVIDLMIITLAAENDESIGTHGKEARSKLMLWSSGSWVLEFSESIVAVGWLTSENCTTSSTYVWKSRSIVFYWNIFLYLFLLLGGRFAW